MQYALDKLMDVTGGVVGAEPSHSCHMLGSASSAAPPTELMMSTPYTSAYSADLVFNRYADLCTLNYLPFI
jgi:hypothetical protein